MDSVKYTFRFREKYLAGQVSAEEKREFESELSRNPQLLEQLKQQIYLGEIVGEALEEDSTVVNTPDENTDSTHTESGLERPTVVMPLVWYREPAKLAAAVAFFLVCCVGVWWMANSGENMNDKLFAENYRHLSNQETTQPRRSADPTVIQDNPLDSLLFDALQTYSRDNFEAASKELAVFIDSGNDSLKIGRFYRAMASLKLEKYESAINDLELYLDNNSDGKYIQDANWYLALVYLKEGNFSGARSILEKLASEDGPYKIRSEKLNLSMQNLK
ncbi:MAG: hypothetical protein R8P61_16440 [Bacteroidia bacterium]|nr:hypothetical protein [Bacteroidia bacterium]